MSRGKGRAYVRFLAELRAYLNHPISPEHAHSTVERRLHQRAENFLGVMRRAVFGNSASPYLPLLRRAGCGYGDMAEGVRRHGLERLLQELERAGVFISLDEFKGNRPICRDGLELPVRNEDFVNLLTSATVPVGSSGTSGRRSRTTMDLDFLSERASQDALLFELLDLRGVPLALWYPPLPAVTGLGNTLRYAKLGCPPARWFCLPSDNRARLGFDSRLATRALIWVSQLSRCALAPPEPTPLERVDVVLDWMLHMRQRRGRCALQSYVSQAVRVCRLARERGVDLRGVQFLVDSEPLTTAKAREIEAVGAAVFARYAATETGLIAFGCSAPREVGEYHAALDGMAVIQATVDPEPAPLYLTSLWTTAPCVLLNVQLGDSGLADEYRCGCFFEHIGFAMHLRRVGSNRRATSEGMAVEDHVLIRLVEELLPAWFGGSPLDYQWIEEEDHTSLARLYLRVDERVGAIDEEDLVGRVLAEIARTRAGRTAGSVWSQAGTIRVVRQKSRLTSSGKHLPLWRDRSAPAANRPVDGDAR